MKKMIVRIGLLGAIGVLFSGCGVELQPSIAQTGERSYKIVADTDKSINAFEFYNIKAQNIKYAFAMAADLTRKKGYSYFTVKNPSSRDYFISKGVKTVDDVYAACTSLDSEALSWTYSLNLKEFGKGNSACDKLTTMHAANSQHSFPAFLLIKLHNENKADFITFNADEVLSSPIIKELDMSKIANIPVREY